MEPLFIAMAFLEIYFQNRFLLIELNISNAFGLFGSLVFDNPNITDFSAVSFFEKLIDILFRGFGVELKNQHGSVISLRIFDQSL